MKALTRKKKKKVTANLLAENFYIKIYCLRLQGFGCVSKLIGKMHNNIEREKFTNRKKNKPFFFCFFSN